LIIKFGSISKFSTVKWQDVKDRYPEFHKRVASGTIPIDIKEYMYLRNEAVHAEDFHGPNENADGFPLDELRDRYHTFRNARSTADHRDNLVIGQVFDTVFVEPIFTRSGSSDEKKFSGGGYVENLIGLSYKKIEALEKKNLIPKGIPQLILDGKITDTSMGAIVEKTICSICDNIAYNEDEYCEHIRGGKNREVKLADGSSKKVWERCYGVTFFEDAIIIPLELGGLAGGEGADTQSKIKNIVTESVAWESRINDVYKRILKSGTKEEAETFEYMIDILGG